MVGVVMGSESDYKVMVSACKVLHDFGVPFEERILSAHRTPELVQEYARNARSRRLRCIIAGAGGAAHLPGMLAAYGTVPVLGVPINATCLSGLDALLSIVQMPFGVPTAAFSIDGAGNAAIFAVEILAVRDEGLHDKLLAFRARQAEAVTF